MASFEMASDNITKLKCHSKIVRRFSEEIHVDSEVNSKYSFSLVYKWKKYFIEIRMCFFFITGQLN